MPSLGSVTEGMVGTQLDLQNIQLNNQQMQSNTIKIQDEAVQLTKDKIGLAQQMKMLQLLQNYHVGQQGGGGQAPASTPDEMSSWLNDLSSIQLQSGLVDDAAKTANVASRIQENSSKVDYRSFKMQNDRFSKFASVLDTVQDSPQGLQQAVAMMAAEDPGVAKDPKFQAIAKMPWQPGLLGALKRQVLSAKDAAEIKYKGAATEHAAAAAAVDRARVGLVREQTKVQEQREKILKKDGATLYKSEQLKAITDMATRDYTTADAADIRVRARPLAEQVASMMKNQNLTLSEASTRVYEKARTEGVFSGLRQSLVTKGSKPGLPLDLPKTQKEVRQNQWYMVDGVPKIALGTKFYSEEEQAASDKDDENLLDDTEDDEDEARAN